VIHVNGSTAYFSDEDFVRAMDVTSGREKWRFRDHDWTPTDADVADDRYAFGGFGDGRIVLQVLTSSDGSPVFSRSFDSDSTRLRVAAGGGFVAFASAPRSSVVCVYDLSEASERYTLEFDGPTRAVEIRGNTLFVGGELSAYDVATGERRWTVSKMERATQWPTLTESRIYAPTSNGVAAIDHEAGTLLWEHDLDRGDTRANPGVSDGTVAIGVKQTVSVVGLDAGTGELKWTTELGGVAGFPVETVSGVFVTAATDGKLYALDPATGDVVGTTRLPGQPNTQPRTRLASSDDTAVVGLETNGAVTYTVSER
jgi:outer membrane protein assembly factor BamB